MVSPNFSFNLLDRFLVSLEYKDIEPVIYLTKVDLLDEPQRQEVTEIKQIYEALGYAVIASEDVEATKELERFFPERLTVFMGQSGAGKSTLMNVLSGLLQPTSGEILMDGQPTSRYENYLQFLMEIENRRPVYKKKS